MPPLLIDRRDFLNPDKNPFFEHADTALFLAQDGNGNDIGRIAAIVNHRHNETHKDHIGFFGMFDCFNNPNAANKLFNAATGFLREHGMNAMRGPMNMSVNDDTGLLVNGFETSPFVMMPHNPPYYENLVKDYGFEKVKDLYAYYGECTDGQIPEHAIRGADLASKRHGFVLRKINMKKFDDEVKMIHELYTRAWEDNWGAVAMTGREFEHLAKDLKLVIDSDLVFIAEVGGRAVGFSLALPDINQALKKINGRLLPFGILKLLWYKRKIDAMRVITMGILKEYRKMGIDSAFYCETYKNALKKGIWRAEMSWILEDNTAMNNVLQNLGFKIYKTYRVYDYGFDAA